MLKNTTWWSVVNVPRIQRHKNDLHNRTRCVYVGELFSPEVQEYFWEVSHQCLLLYLQP